MTDAPSEFDQSPVVPARRPVISQTTLIAAFLFLATCLSTFGTWVIAHEGLSAQTSIDVLIRNGLEYAVPVMLILLCHEMGHYLMARAHGVPATLPFFLPLPVLSPLGTLGALIVQARGYADRRAMFDIAIAGPIAGFVVAVPVAWYGVQQAVIQELPTNGHYEVFGDPLLLKGMIWLRFGDEYREGYDVVMNPMYLAGWAGLFLTGLNLVPIGQLDGGHILYCLLRRRAVLVSYLMMGIAIASMIYFGDPAYSLMIVLLMVIGVRHPPTSNDHARLGPFRVTLGWATLALFFVCFTPFPMTKYEPDPAISPVKQVEIVDVTPDSVTLRGRWRR